VFLFLSNKNIRIGILEFLAENEDIRNNEDKSRNILIQLNLYDSIKKDYFELNKTEVEELNSMIHKCKEIIEKDYTPDGYNIGMNCSEAAGQTIFQYHCHVIPRYKGDMKEPKGGVRHCIEGKGYY
jgi:diadenosine tetraphosphate (Ap4A) HIT family hydrolase